MKKVVFLAVAVILTAGMTQVVAQPTFKAGIKGEANFSNYILKDMSSFDSEMKAGASLGGFTKISFNRNFAIQPELMFHYRATELKNDVTRTKGDYEYWGMEIPVYAVGQLQLGQGNAYVGIGPYVGLGFSLKSDPGDVDLYKKDKITDKAAMQRWDFGFGAMLGYEFDFGLQINAGYKIGVINALDAGKDDAKMLPQVLSVGIGYSF